MRIHICEIETRSRPRLLAATRHGFTFYVADPISSIETRSSPGLFTPTLVTLPSMPGTP